MAESENKNDPLNKVKRQQRVRHLKKQLGGMLGNRSGGVVGKEDPMARIQRFTSLQAERHWRDKLEGKSRVLRQISKREKRQSALEDRVRELKEEQRQADFQALLRESDQHFQKGDIDSVNLAVCGYKEALEDYPDDVYARKWLELSRIKKKQLQEKQNSESGSSLTAAETSVEQREYYQTDYQDSRLSLKNMALSALSFLPVVALLLGAVWLLLRLFSPSEADPKSEKLAQETSKEEVAVVVSPASAVIQGGAVSEEVQKKQSVEPALPVQEKVEADWNLFAAKRSPYPAYFDFRLSSLSDLASYEGLADLQNSHSLYLLNPVQGAAKLSADSADSAEAVVGAVEKGTVLEQRLESLVGRGRVSSLQSNEAIETKELSLEVRFADREQGAQYLFITGIKE